MKIGTVYATPARGYAVITTTDARVRLARTRKIAREIRTLLLTFGKQATILENVRIVGRVAR